MEGPATAGLLMQFIPCHPLDMASGGRTAVIIGASSGIGEALARELHQTGWCLGLFARRMDKLETLAEELGAVVSVGYIDVSKIDCTGSLQALMDDLDDVDLIIISAGCGFLNPMHDNGPDFETVSVNVLGFMALAQAAFRYFKKRGHGHLAVITSVAALRGNGEATVYAASKAFQSIFLVGAKTRSSAQKPECSGTFTRGEIRRHESVSPWGVTHQRVYSLPTVTGESSDGSPAFISLHAPPKRDIRH